MIAQKDSRRNRNWELPILWNTTNITCKIRRRFKYAILKVSEDLKEISNVTLTFLFISIFIGIRYRFAGSMSDNCITKLLGTSPKAHGRSCIITKECLQYATQPNRKGYHLTHQFIYFLFGINNGTVFECTYIRKRNLSSSNYLFYMNLQLVNLPN